MEYYLRNDRIYTKAKKEEYKRLKAEKEKEILENDEWQRGDWAYEWYSSGELKSVKLPDGQIIKFEYDALGRRTKKIFNDKIIRYLWDGNILLHEWEYLKEEEPRKIINELGEISFDRKEPVQNLVTWVYEQGSFIPCAKIVDNKCYSIVNDYIGRPIQAFDSFGNLVWQTEYDIYGNLRNLQGDRNFVPFRQLGQYEDEETGLYYNRFRYYDSFTGLYISKDPISILGGLNVYAYVHDPNSWVDIFGLECGKPTKYHKRTTWEVAELRRAFDKIGGARELFLKSLAQDPKSIKKYGIDIVEVMKKGNVPKNMVVHHKKPLFRGGTNDFDNLILLDKNYHLDNNKALHWYEEGKNPFGLN